MVSDKDFYDEDEIIDSIVNEKAPSMTEESQRNQGYGWNRNQNVRVQQVGCGCFDSRKFVINFLIYSVTLMVTAGLFPGFYIDGIASAIWAALTLTLLNTFVKPIIVFFTFPLTVVTLGAFYFVVNGIIIMMTARIMGDSFIITNFLIAMIAAIFISIIQQFIKKQILKVDHL